MKHFRLSILLLPPIWPAARSASSFRGSADKDTHGSSNNNNNQDNGSERAVEIPLVSPWSTTRSRTSTSARHLVLSLVVLLLLVVVLPSGQAFVLPTQASRILLPCPLALDNPQSCHHHHRLLLSPPPPTFPTSLPVVVASSSRRPPWVRSTSHRGGGGGGGTTTMITSSTALRQARKASGGRPAGSSAATEAQEWQAIVAAFQMYKAAYGDLKIPQRFVVPSMKPWPKAAWGMRLGKVVMHMRATGKYVHDQPDRKQVLDDLGFVWQVRVSEARPKVTLSQVYTALEYYKQYHPSGSTHVEETFVVPNTEDWPESVRELPLGKSLVSLRKQLDKNANQKWKERFAALGWPATSSSSSSSSDTSSSTATVRGSVDNIDAAPSAAPETAPTSAAPPKKKLSANDERFRKVFLGLKTYRDIYGDLLVPQPFAIPLNDAQWPQDTWGLRLGARVNAIRSQGTFINGNPERRQLLDEIGFVWAPPKTDRRARKTENAVGTRAPGAPGDGDANDDALNDLFGGDFSFKDFGLDGPGRGDEPPTLSWSFEGGGDLQDLTKPPPDESKEDEYLPPRTFQESLDEAVDRAKEAGIITGLTDRRRVIKGKQEKNIPWFNDDFGDDFVFEDVVEALTLYKSFYGDFSNLTKAFDFVIPSPVEQTGFLDDDDDDDLATFDVDASARAAQAIAKFEQAGDVGRSDELISAEIERLQKEVGTVTEEVEVETEPETATETERAFDDENVEWPEHLGGMKLGNIIARIRDGSLEVKHLPDRKAQLDQIDFDWGDEQKFIDIPFEKSMCAMYAYYMIRGDMFVYEDFVMPDEDPWPEALAGFEIGKAVKRLRELQNFLEAYHPEKVSLLRMIDFVWFPTMALPIDPDEPEMDDELLKLSALGHPDYSKMIDIPMGLPDRIIADGPFYESDNPKHWWRIWHNWDYVKDYWYQQGRRDNAYVLRAMGYPRMADQHEAKYGPGLFTLIEGTLSTIEAGLGDKTAEEKTEILSKLRYYRQEMLGCTDVNVEERERLLKQFDDLAQGIMKESNISFNMEEEETDYEEEEVGDDEEYEYEEYEYEEDEYEEEGGDDDDDDVIDIEDELGLDS